MLTRILDCPKCRNRFEYSNDGEIPDMIVCPICGENSALAEYSALMLCPHCRKKLSVPLDMLQEAELQCPHCLQDFSTADSAYMSELDRDTAGLEADRKDWAPALAEGEIFDKFQILRFIGRGGMAEVYLAEHLLLKQTCALKLLAGFQMNAVMQKRFIREARIAHEIDHPDIVKVFDVGTEPRSGRMFIAMEYVEGTDLAELAGRKPFTEPELWDVLNVMTSALHTLEEKKVVHRDIKPSNIMRKNDGTLKLMDLGIAKTVTDDNSGELTLTMAQSVIGTPGFASPEQSRSSHDTDIRSDFFSLGATLYFLASGQYPFGGNTAIEIILNVIKTEPEPLEKFRPDLSPKLVKTVRKLMAKSPDDRPQNTAELQQMIDGDEVPGKWRLNWKTGGRVRKTAVISVILLAALFGILYRSMRLKPAESRDSVPAVMPGALPAAADLFYPLQTAPDGSLVLNSLDQAKSPPQALLLRRVYAPPFEIRAVCAVQLTNVRFRLCRGEVIFNWERNPKMLKVNIPGIKSAELQNADGQVPCDQWVDYRIAVAPDRMDIYAAGKLRQTVRGSFSAAPVGMFTCCGGRLKVRSFAVKSGPGGASEPFSFTVNTDQDKEDPADGAVSLREAVNHAEGLWEEPVIRFQHDMTVQLAAPLTVRRSITVDGAASQIRLTGPAAGRMFSLAGRVLLKLKNLDLQSDFQGKGAGIVQVNDRQQVQLLGVTDSSGTAKLNWLVTGKRNSGFLQLSDRSRLHRIMISSQGMVKVLSPDAAVSEVTVQGRSPYDHGYGLVQAGTADTVRIAGGGGFFVREQAQARNITVQNGGHLGIQGGKVRDFTVGPGCDCAYRNNARLSGRITLSGPVNRVGKISHFSLDPQSEIVLDLAQLKPSEKTLLDDLKRFSGAKTYEIRVRENQPAGIYALCGNAAGFQPPFSLRIADRMYPGVLRPGMDFTAGPVRYRLNVSGKNVLELIIGRH